MKGDIRKAMLYLEAGRTKDGGLFVEGAGFAATPLKKFRVTGKNTAAVTKKVVAKLGSWNVSIVLAIEKQGKGVQ